MPGAESGSGSGHRAGCPADEDYKLVRREVRRASAGGVATTHGVAEAREEVLARLDAMFQDLAVTRGDGRECEVTGRRAL